MMVLYILLLFHILFDLTRRTYILHTHTHTIQYIYIPYIIIVFHFIHIDCQYLLSFASHSLNG